MTGGLATALAFFQLSLTSSGPGSTITIAALGQTIAAGKVPVVPNGAGYALLMWPFITAASLVAVLLRRPEVPLSACLIAGSSAPICGLLTARANVVGGGALVATLAWGIQLIGVALLLFPSPWRRCPRAVPLMEDRSR